MTAIEPKFITTPLACFMPQLEHPVSRFFGKGQIGYMEHEGNIYRFAIFNARYIGAN